MNRKLLFLDRDGCLIEEPADQQVDSFAKLALMPNVVPALRRCVSSGYELVMVTNQDGLGTKLFPQADFDGPHRLLIQILASQGIEFREILIDSSLPEEARPTRKPGTALVHHYLADDTWNRSESAMVGDRDTDMAFAANLGVRGLCLGLDGLDWLGIANRLCDRPRVATVERQTRETRVRVNVNLDGVRGSDISTGIGFFDHMLEQFGKHGGFSLGLTCQGDLHIDSHHTIEDCGLSLGQALREALGEKRGIARYGFTLPMDDSVASACLDLSGRPWFELTGQFADARVGEMPTEMVPHFFRSLCEAMGANLHLSIRGQNTHHAVEACFKVVGRAFRQAIRRDDMGLPSTKGVL